MSKLDAIIGYTQWYNNEFDKQARLDGAKQQIKDLMLELIGEYDEYYPGNEGVHRTLDALRKKVSEL